MCPGPYAECQLWENGAYVDQATVAARAPADVGCNTNADCQSLGAVGSYEEGKWMCPGPYSQCHKWVNGGYVDQATVRAAGAMCLAGKWGSAWNCANSVQYCTSSTQ